MRNLLKTLVKTKENPYESLFAACFFKRHSPSCCFPHKPLSIKVLIRHFASTVSLRAREFQRICPMEGERSDCHRPPVPRLQRRIPGSTGHFFEFPGGLAPTWPGPPPERDICGAFVLSRNRNISNVGDTTQIFTVTRPLKGFLESSLVAFHDPPV